LGEQLYQLAQRDATPTHLLEAHAACGAILFSLGEYAAARIHLEQGIALTGPAVQRTIALRHDVPPEVQCLIYAANTLWCLGYPMRAVRRCQEALTLAQELAHPHGLAFAQHFAAFLFHRRREATIVQAQADALLTLATAQGFPLFVGLGTCWRGCALSMQGQSEAGLAQLYQGLAAVLATGQILARPLAPEAQSVQIAPGGGSGDGIAKGSGHEGRDALPRPGAGLEPDLAWGSLDDGLQLDQLGGSEPGARLSAKRGLQAGQPMGIEATDPVLHRPPAPPQLPGHVLGRLATHDERQGQQPLPQAGVRGRETFLE
jgi:hypothetical protein